MGHPQGSKTTQGLSHIGINKHELLRTCSIFICHKMRESHFQKPIPILIDTILSVLYNKLNYIFLKAVMGISNL